MRIAKTAITSTSPSNGPSRFSQVRARRDVDTVQLGFASTIMFDKLYFVVFEKMQPKGRTLNIGWPRFRVQASACALSSDKLKLIELFQILIQRRMQQSLRFRRVEVVPPNHRE